MAAIYEDMLLPQDVLSNYEAKLPYSEPSVYDMDITINEDGEATAGLHYSTPEYYQSECPVDDLGLVALTAFDQVTTMCVCV
jgi:hypothetical protein